MNKRSFISMETERDFIKILRGILDVERCNTDQIEKLFERQARIVEVLAKLAGHEPFDGNVIDREALDRAAAEIAELEKLFRLEGRR
jgi:hypothetical protein